MTSLGSGSRSNPRKDPFAAPRGPGAHPRTQRRPARLAWGIKLNSLQLHPSKRNLFDLPISPHLTIFLDRNQFYYTLSPIPSHPSAVAAKMMIKRRVERVPLRFVFHHVTGESGRGNRTKLYTFVRDVLRTTTELFQDFAAFKKMD